MPPKRDKFTCSPVLQKLLKQLTESGLQELDRAKMAELLDLCRNAPSNVQNTFRILFAQLEKPHAEIRLSSLQIINDLFEQFESFRICVVDRIKDLVHLVVQYDPDKPLPPPKVVAERLSYQACRSIAEWKRSYGQKYVELELMYKYMQNVYKINFNGPQPVPAQPVNSRHAKIKELQLKKATEELTSKLVEVNSNLDEFWSCMKLLMPSPEDFDVPLGCGVGSSGVESTSISTPCKYTGSSLREEGYRAGVTVSLVLPERSKIVEIAQNDDNSAVLENLRTCYYVCSKHHLLIITSLLEKVSKLGASSDVVKSAIDAKSQLIKAQSAFENIKIKWRNSSNNEGDESDDESDWIEVPATTNEESPDKQLQQRIVAESKDTDDAGGDKSQDNSSGDSKDVPTPSIPKLLLDEIPPSDYQGDPAFTKLHSKEDNIWCNSADFDAEAGTSAASSMLAEAISTRTYFFVSKEGSLSTDSVCGAPLGNGKFCPRRDKVKCPFHGPIGSWHQQSKDEEGGKKLEDVASTSAQSWRDPGLERDISAAIGINLAPPVKSRKRSGLTQLKPDNPKTRIAKKLSSAAERVADDMNRQDAKRNHDKFCHSFSYSLSRTLF